MTVRGTSATALSSQLMKDLLAAGPLIIPNEISCSCKARGESVIKQLGCVLSNFQFNLAFCGRSRSGAFRTDPHRSGQQPYGDCQEGTNEKGSNCCCDDRLGIPTWQCRCKPILIERLFSDTSQI